MLRLGKIVLRANVSIVPDSAERLAEEDGRVGADGHDPAALHAAADVLGGKLAAFEEAQDEEQRSSRRGQKWPKVEARNWKVRL